MVLHTGKKYISLVPSCHLPRVATEWHFTCLISHLDLCSFYLQPLKFTYTLSLPPKNYSACWCYLQAVTGSPLNFPLDKDPKYLSFFSPTHLCLQVLLFFFNPLWFDGLFWVGGTGLNTMFPCWLIWDNNHLPPPTWTLPDNCICSTNCYWLPPSHYPILRNGRNLAAQILPGKSDLDLPIDITPCDGPWGSSASHPAR